MDGWCRSIGVTYNWKMEKCLLLCEKGIDLFNTKWMVWPHVKNAKRTAYCRTLKSEMLTPRPRPTIKYHLRSESVLVCGRIQSMRKSSPLLFALRRTTEHWHVTGWRCVSMMYLPWRNPKKRKRDLTYRPFSTGDKTHSLWIHLLAHFVSVETFTVVQWTNNIQAFVSASR